MYQHAYQDRDQSLTQEDRPYKRSDSGGLFIHVQHNGAKLWRFAYRFTGKQKLLSGGPYPQLSLLAARAWRDEMKQQLALGLDPSEERRQVRAAADAQQSGRARNTFEHVAREWLEIRLLSWTPRYAALVTDRLDADIFPVIGPLDIARITPRQLLERYT